LAEPLIGINATNAADASQAPSPGDILRTDFRGCYRRLLDAVANKSAVVTFLATAAPNFLIRLQLDITAE
jgi:hypothetical protein